MTNAPCYKCAERHTACWDSCERYREWKSAEQADKEKKSQDKIYDNYIVHKFSREMAKKRQRNRRENK